MSSDGAPSSESALSCLAPTPDKHRLRLSRHQDISDNDPSAQALLQRISARPAVMCRWLLRAWQQQGDTRAVIRSGAADVMSVWVDFPLEHPIQEGTDGAKAAI